MPQNLVNDYGVTYSTHTHGPYCGAGHSSEACSDTRVVNYILERKQAIEDISGTTIIDHNGNFDHDIMEQLAEHGYRTLSAYKNKTTQKGYDYLIVNPWRPHAMDAWNDESSFLLHDSESALIYLPNLSSPLTVYHKRIKEYMKRILSQFIKHANRDAVNVLNIVIHVDSFRSFEGKDLDDYLPTRKEGEQYIVEPSAEFEEHISYWDDLLTNVIDPLVNKGYLQWATADTIADEFAMWERLECLTLSNPVRKEF